MSIELLRRETRQNHQRLEERLNIRSQCATSHSYRRLLERFYGFYLPYEASLQTHRAALPSSLNLRERTRLPQLTEDLTAMSAPIDQLPQCPNAPQPTSRAETLGCLYVTEGSTLGGQIIRRMIQDSHGSNAPPTAFFDGYGAQTGARWRELCAAIDGADLSSGEQAAMAAAARNVFQTLETWLCSRHNDRAL